MRQKSKLLFLLTLVLVSMVSPAAFAAQADCDLGQVYVEGVGCQTPQIKQEIRTFGVDGTALGSSVSGGSDVIRIDNPFAAPGQPVQVELTVSNIGAQYPFNLIPLPPNQYAIVMSIDPPEQILYKDPETGQFKSYDIDSAEWGSWFGSSWASKAWFYLNRAVRDSQEVLSDDLCKYVNVGELYPEFAKKRFVYDNYRDEIEEKRGTLTEKNFQDKIKEEDLEKYFPAVYEWQCIRSVDLESFYNEVNDEGYCGGTVTMGCMGQYMRENIGKLKTTSFIILTNELPEEVCEYNEDDSVTYCGVGEDGICPPNTQATCQGKSEYTFKFMMLVPADAPALSPQEFNQLVEGGQIIGDFQVDAVTGEATNFGFTESAQCPGDAYSAGCHVLNVRVQAVNAKGLASFFRSTIGGAAGGVAVGAGAALFSGGVGFALGTIGGVLVGVTKGLLTWGDITLIGAPIYEAQGIFYVVAPALKVAATLTLYLALVAGGASGFLLRRRR